MKRILFFSIVFFGILLLNTKDDITLSGKIKVKGSEPNTYLFSPEISWS